jgi:hypothetical protein
MRHVKSTTTKVNQKRKPTDLRERTVEEGRHMMSDDSPAAPPAEPARQEEEIDLDDLLDGARRSKFWGSARLRAIDAAGFMPGGDSRCLRVAGDWWRCLQMLWTTLRTR